MKAKKMSSDFSDCIDYSNCSIFHWIQLDDSCRCDITPHSSKKKDLRHFQRAQCSQKCLIMRSGLEFSLPSSVQCKMQLIQILADAPLKAMFHILSYFFNGNRRFASPCCSLFSKFRKNTSPLVGPSTYSHSNYFSFFLASILDRGFNSTASHSFLRPNWLFNLFSYNLFNSRNSRRQYSSFTGKLFFL